MSTHSKLWLTAGITFILGTGLSFIAWLWRNAGEPDELVPLRAALIAVVTQLFLVGLGSFVMAAKFRKDYLEDDSKLN